MSKFLYWIPTILLALFILPGIFYINSPMAKEGSNHVGPFPTWFMWEAGIGSFIGGLLLVLPSSWVSSRLKEWAYVALGIVYISAFIGHMTVDGVSAASFMPVVTFALLLMSYVYRHKLRAAGKTY